MVKLTLEPGGSVASVARANGVNANQVFRWKRQHERDDLQSRRSRSASVLVPMTIAAEPEVAKAPEPSGSAPVQQCAGSITIEFPGRALLSIEGAADPAVTDAHNEEDRRLGGGCRRPAWDHRLMAHIP
jgi:transposase